jgi:hypothetical protein
MNHEFLATHISSSDPWKDIRILLKLDIHGLGHFVEQLSPFQ